MNILALGAHPDDIEIYMFGALAAWKAMGAKLAFAIATDGSKGGTIEPGELARLRKVEAAVAAAQLDVVPEFLGFTDGELIADVKLVAVLKRLIADTEPDLIVTHAPNDYHGDHRALSDAMRIASSFQAPVLWADAMQGVGFMPTHYIETTAHIGIKAEAIRAHVSQKPERFVARTQLLAAFRASQANAAEGIYAEAYRFEPSFPFVDIRELLPPAPKVRPVGDRRNPRNDRDAC
jgi:LmbE family N-acetylglucosaminyl deacetylase